MTCGWYDADALGYGLGPLRPGVTACLRKSDHPMPHVGLIGRSRWVHPADWVMFSNALDWERITRHNADRDPTGLIEPDGFETRTTLR